MDESEAVWHWGVAVCLAVVSRVLQGVCVCVSARVCVSNCCCAYSSLCVHVSECVLCRDLCSVWVVSGTLVSIQT